MTVALFGLVFLYVGLREEKSSYESGGLCTYNYYGVEGGLEPCSTPTEKEIGTNKLPGLACHMPASFQPPGRRPWSCTPPSKRYPPSPLPSSAEIGFFGRRPGWTGLVGK